MDDEAISQFITFTSSTPEKAAQYLTFADGDLQGALDLYFANEGVDLQAPAPTSTQPLPTSSVANPSTAQTGSEPRYHQDRHGVVHIDSGSEDEDFVDEDEPVQRSSHRHPAPALNTPPTATPPNASAYDDDEAMARRLQEEYYGNAGLGPDGVRAPIGRTTETLVGPGADMSHDDLRAAVQEQIEARNRRSRQRGTCSH